ncbi:hypothetical protein [Listeria fleischmannii]|uniref:hypothetical protein n=1 Tax=Listeria fleischmannii TaxID=1069827 RepID=UPI000254F72B|nr:hypothetical protein [Listeria fleischmannii]EIA19397.1 hypothetical protein KKC_12605 [Listeria fleischmannii subsp. coloradonensis]STY34366.1 Uncharacterised protein [Listeria fleischmannii subsp. coloradonensis]
MRKYIVHISFYLLALVYGTLLGLVISGSPLTKSSLSDQFTYLIGGLVGALIGLSLVLPDIKKRLERNEVDERYIKKRGQFSFYFLVSLFVLIPLLLFFFNLNGAFEIHTRAIAKCVFILIIIYSAGLYFMKKR